MDDNFSPKQVAMALRVSESSVKRWCDRGVIGTIKTFGGHRRISFDALMEFLSVSNRKIAEPSAIGLGKVRPPIEGVTPIENPSLNIALFRLELEQALIRGDEKECRKILIRWYGIEQSVALMADDLIGPTFVRIGQLWHESEIEIFQERRACEICIRLANEFRRVIIEPLPSAPSSLGCTSAGDHYCVPGHLIELTMREAGWRATNIGSNVPFASLAAAVRSECPEIVWLSVSYIEDRVEFVREINEFSDSLPQDVSFVVGGRALSDDLRPKLRYTAHCDTMVQLSTLARALRTNKKQVRAKLGS